jgi:hypothetical protein
MSKISTVIRIAAIIATTCSCGGIEQEEADSESGIYRSDSYETEGDYEDTDTAEGPNGTGGGGKCDSSSGSGTYGGEPGTYNADKSKCCWFRCSSPTACSESCIDCVTKSDGTNTCKDVKLETTTTSYRAYAHEYTQDP